MEGGRKEKISLWGLILGPLIEKKCESLMISVERNDLSEKQHQLVYY